MMPDRTNDAADSEACRKALFRALIECQDRGVSVATSRIRVAESFGVTDKLMAEVEREGLDKGWPPL